MDSDNFCFLGCDAVQFGSTLPAYLRNLLPPYWVLRPDEVIHFSENFVIFYQSTWRIAWVSKSWHARLFYTARSHMYKLYVCIVTMEHKFRRLCITLVIFMRAASEKYHKNRATICPPPPPPKKNNVSPRNIQEHVENPSYNNFEEYNCNYIIILLDSSSVYLRTIYRNEHRKMIKAL